MKVFAALFLVALVTGNLLAQQVPDTVFVPKVGQPKYAKGHGPVVVIDEAHNNFHTAVNRFRPFALLLGNDGYQVRRGTSVISGQSLAGVDVLVISNALNKENIGSWTLPTPSAFTDSEIEVMKSWVEKGGSLLLIADHMPFPGAAEKLAGAFGFKFYNGFALTDEIVFAPEVFCLANHRLHHHTTTSGLDSIMTFTGQGFDIPSKAQPVLSLDEEFYMLLPQTAWAFNEKTERMEGAGKFQGATLEVGKGRVAVFGEAASFSAQISQGMFHMGFNHPHAKNNAQFVLNVMHWLDAK